MRDGVQERRNNEMALLYLVQVEKHIDMRKSLQVFKSLNEIRIEDDPSLNPLTGDKLDRHISCVFEE